MKHRTEPLPPVSAVEAYLHRVLIQVAECRIVPRMRGDVILAIQQARNALQTVWHEDVIVESFDKSDNAPWRKKRMSKADEASLNRIINDIDKDLDEDPQMQKLFSELDARYERVARQRLARKEKPPRKSARRKRMTVRCGNIKASF